MTWGAEGGRDFPIPSFFSAWVTVLTNKAQLVTKRVLMNSVPLYSPYQAQFQKIQPNSWIFSQKLTKLIVQLSSFLSSQSNKTQWYFLAHLELHNFFWFGCYGTLYLKSFHWLECRGCTFTGNSTPQPNISSSNGNFSS